MIKKFLRDNPVIFYILAGLLWIYWTTWSKTVTLEDSGLFIVSAKSLGIAHPPGYPLYTMLAHLFTYLPFGTVAERVHLFSAVASLGALFFLYLIIRRFVKSRISAEVAVLAFGLTQTFWSQATVAEVYALHSFFIFLLTWLALKINSEWSAKTFWLFAFFYGLSLTNHWPLIGLFSPAWLVLFWPHKSKIFKSIPVGVLAGLLGLLPYLYLIIRSSQNPQFQFLTPVTSFSELVDYILRKNYASVDAQSTYSLMDSIKFVAQFFWLGIREFVFVGVALALFGYWKNFKKLKWPIWAFLGFGFFSSNLILQFVFHSEFNELTENVFSVWQGPALSIWAIGMALGIDEVIQILATKTKLPRRIIRPASTGLVMMLVLFIYSYSIPYTKLRNDGFAADYAKLTLSGIPNKQTLLVRGDTDVGPIVYVHHVDKYRDDLKLLNQSGHLFRERLFSPIGTSSREKTDKTVNFIQKSGRVFSTRKIDVFQNTKRHYPFSFEFNGLFYEVTTGRVETNPLPSEVERAKAFVEQYGPQASSKPWSYHRNAILAQVCNYLILHGQEELAVFKSLAGCAFIKARHLDRFKKHREADEYYQLALIRAPRLPSSENVNLEYFAFKNKVEMLNSQPTNASEKASLINADLPRLLATAHRIAGCGNPLIRGLLVVKQKWPLNLPLKRLKELYRGCPELKGLWP